MTRIDHSTKALPQKERRHPENARLREKINHIQATGEQLRVLSAQVQKQTLDWARSGRVTDLPSADLAAGMTSTFDAQRMALHRMHCEGNCGGCVQQQKTQPRGRDSATEQAMFVQ